MGASKRVEGRRVGGAGQVEGYKEEILTVSWV